MCYQCQIKPVYEFTNKRKVCKNCFIKWFEKKALYSIRKFDMINKEEIIKYKDKKDFRTGILKEILEMLAKKGRIRIIKKGKFDKFADSKTIDLIAYSIINNIIQKENKNLRELLPKNKKIIQPLYLFLDKEVLLYAKLKKLKFKEIKIKKDKISNFLNNLEKKHPEVKRAIVKSFLKLEI